jgi:hypothetical protein
MAEKRKPTYDIAAIKAVFSTVEKLSVTGSALKVPQLLAMAAEISLRSYRASTGVIFISR